MTAKALGRLIPINTNYFMENKIIEGLIKKIEINNFNARHGILYALGDILIGLTGKT